jgi:hypothetical protein
MTDLSRYTHSAHANINLADHEQLAQLHDTARREANRLRRESISELWQRIGFALGSIMAAATRTGTPPANARDRSLATSHCHGSTRHTRILSGR